MREVIEISNFDEDDAAGQAWRERFHATHHDLADITELEAARQRYLRERDPGEPALALVALVAKASVTALAAFPRLHGDEARGRPVGMAVGTAGGLQVSVLRDADRKPTRALAVELEALTAREHGCAFLPADAASCPFFIADATAMGDACGVSSIPLPGISPVAILGLSRARSYLVEWDDALQERLYLPLSLTYDQRVVDAADAARLTRAVAELLANPLRLLMAC